MVVCDLTWTDAIGGELMFDYELVIVPTSVSEIELAATAGFLNRHRWVFDSAIQTPPMLLLTPTRIRADQIQGDCFSKQRFAISFMLAPPILESQGARDLFEQGYLMDLQDVCDRSFLEFGMAVLAAREMRLAAVRDATMRAAGLATTRIAAKVNQDADPLYSTRLRTVTDLSSHCSILGRHRMQKIRDNESSSQAAGVAAPLPTGLAQFLKKLSTGSVDPS